MANEKILNTRILLKTDTLEAWNSSTLPLKKGEIAIATVAATAGSGLTEPVCMIKIGEDGVKTFKDLPWNFYAKASDVVAAAKSEDTLKAFVNGVIADAGIASSSAMEALSGRVTTAEGEIDALQAALDTAETGLKARMTAAEGDIAALEGLVGDTKVADQITAAINALNLGTTYEAKGAAEAVRGELNAYKTTNDAAVLANTNNITANTNAINAIKDGTAIDSFADVEAELAKKEAAGAAAAAEAAAKAYADGLAGNYDAKGAAATAESNAKAYAKEYADGLAGNYDANGSAAAAEAAAKKYTDDEMTRLVGETPVSEQVSGAITALDLANTYAAKSHKHVKADITDFAHAHEMDDVNGLADALAGKEAAGAAANALAEAKSYADGKDAAIEAAQTAADKAQEEVDAIETYVGTIPEGYTETNVIAYINKKAQETLDTASGGSSESAASVLAALNTYKAENDPKVTANTEAIADLEELVGDTKVSDAIAAAVKEEADRAKGVEGGLETRLKAVEDTYATDSDVENLQNQINTIMSNPDAEGAINSINEFAQYVKDHGTIADGMRTDINKNKDDIAAEKTRAEGVEAGLQEAINGVAADVEELAGEVDTKAAQADLEALTGRVTTIETEHNAESTGLKARLTQAETDIDALETKVGDKTVAVQISEAIAGENLAQYALAADLDTAEGKIEVLEGKAHEHANKAELDLIASGDKAKWDAKVDDVTAAADSGLKATRTGNTVAIEIDESITFIFDCGGASV